ncbi:replication-associated polyprotein 1a [Privet ringspot virus]|uniref:Replication protein 1a n=1 Tax=Privet ringspot virus TaxID=2169960 RepID=A0A0N9H785_9BROM|nr:replication-associated polyprotein 1a [Privet ringspot virus]ALF95057.1 replication-associated polyprotein 1a [Privet ringspot virus]
MDRSISSTSTTSDHQAIDVDNLVASYVRNIRADDGTNVSRFLGEAALREIRSQIDTSCGDFQKLNVGFKLTPDEKNALKSNFPGLEIVFRDSCFSSHSFAAAHRVCETQDIYNRFQTKTEKIIDLGGNYVTHAKQGRANVHSCCPILDVRDGARHTDRYISLAASVERRHQELPVDFCCRKFEDCNVQAPFAMAVHSISDIEIGQLAKHCVRRGVRKLIASVMMDPLMMVYDKGHMPLLNVDWEKEDVVVDGVITSTLIHFHFVDAPGLSYTHDFNKLSKYMTSNQIIVNDSYSYRVERTACLSGVYIVEMTLSMSDEISLAHLKPMRDVSCAWLSNLRKKVFVKLAVPVSMEWFTESFEIRWALMDEHLVRYVSEAAFRQFSVTKDPQVLVQYIATMLSSSSNHVVVNGITMRNGSPIALDEYVPLAVTFYVMAAWRYKMIAPGIDALKTRVEKNFDKIDDKGVIQEDFNVVNELLTDAGLKNVNLPKISDLTKSFGLRVLKGKDTVKLRDDTVLVRQRSLFREILYDLKKTFGLTLVGDDYNLISSVPSHMKALDVWRVFKDNLGFDSCLNAADCVKDLLDKHSEVMKEKLRQETERKAFLDARDKALVTIAKAIDKDDKIRDGLLPILDLCEIKEDLIAAKNSLGLTQEAIHSSDTRLPVTSATEVNPYADSIKEAISYFNEIEMTNSRNLKALGCYLNWKAGNSWMYSALRGRNENVRVYVPFERKWYPDSRDLPQYERAMSEDGYVSLHWNGNEISANCQNIIGKYHVLVVDESCVFNSGQRMIPALESALKLKPNFKVTIIDGVAGCGKTTHLKKLVNMSGNPDIVLTSNRSSSDELKESIQCDESMKYRIRTVDSYLMMKNWFSSKRLLFDECFLTHAGCVYAAATLAQVEDVVALGDTEQVPFISRLPEFRMQHQRISGKIEVQTTTYRCPRDATACLKKFFYKEKTVKTASVVETSLDLNPIASVVQIPCEDNVLYMTHMRADKDALMKIPGIRKQNVKTTHEAQGETWDNVIMFRLSKTTSLLHSGKDPTLGSCHNLVALSRHRKSFRYFTVAPNDLDDQIVKSINFSKTLTSGDFDAVRCLPNK